MILIKPNFLFLRKFRLTCFKHEIKIRKYKFTNERTDWSDLNHNYKGFIGSYISKELDPEGYKRWESYIRSNYKALRSIYNEF